MSKVEEKRVEVALERLAFYQRKNLKRRNAIRNSVNSGLDSFSSPVDSHIMSNSPKVGWVRTALSYYADKMIFEGLRNSGDRYSEEITDITNFLRDSNFEEITNILHKYALMDGISFALITPGDPSKGEPKDIVSIHSGSEMVVETNRARRIISAVVMNGEKGIYITEKNIYPVAQKNGNIRVGTPQKNPYGFVPVAPYTLDGYLGDTNGIISRSAIGLQADANKAFAYLNASRAYYSLPSRFFFNIAPELLTDENGNDVKMNTSAGASTSVPRDGEQESNPSVAEPKVVQLAGSSPQPILENLSVLSRAFAGEMLIPEHDLTGNMANPTSEPALAASEARLNDRISRYVTNMRVGWLRLAENILRISGKSDEEIAQIKADIIVEYKPLTRETLSAKVDAMSKLVYAGALQGNSEVLLSRIFNADEIRIIQSENNAAQMNALLSALESGENTDVDTELDEVFRQPLPAEE